MEDAKGEFSYGLGNPKRNTIKGKSGIHGFSEEPQVAFIEGELTDRLSLNMMALLEMEDATVTLRLGIGKTIVLTDAWQCGEGVGHSDEGNFEVRFESREKAQEIS